MMIKDELRSKERLEEARDEEDEIRRIAGVDHIESARAPHAPCEAELPVERARIFLQVLKALSSDCASGWRQTWTPSISS